MKALCVRLLDFQGNPQDQSNWLTIGKVYDVLAIMRDENGWRLRLVGDEPNGPALFSLDQFEIVSPQIPNSWVADWVGDNFFELSPSPWIQSGFWEAYYNMEPEAIQIFEDEKNRIINSDP